MERLRFHPPGRRCSITGCPTILNHFNPGPECLLHRDRVEALGFTDPGLARLWVAVEVKRRELRGSSSSSARSVKGGARGRMPAASSRG